MSMTIDIQGMMTIGGAAVKSARPRNPLAIVNMIALDAAAKMHHCSRVPA